MRWCTTASSKISRKNAPACKTWLASRGLGDLGGDDVDLILAQLVLASASVDEASLSSTQLGDLLDQCRDVKEALAPQSRRWCSLDGPWSFAYDDDETGLERDWPSCGVNERIITVPFPPESERSGIGDERAEPYAAKAHRAKVQHHAADRADEDKRDDDHIARLS